MDGFFYKYNTLYDSITNSTWHILKNKKYTFYQYHCLRQLTLSSSGNLEIYNSPDILKAWNMTQVLSANIYCGTQNIGSIYTRYVYPNDNRLYLAYNGNNFTGQVITTVNFITYS